MFQHFFMWTFFFFSCFILFLVKQKYQIGSLVCLLLSAVLHQFVLHSCSLKVQFQYLFISESICKTGLVVKYNNSLSLTPFESKPVLLYIGVLCLSVIHFQSRLKKHSLQGISGSNYEPMQNSCMGYFLMYRMLPPLLTYKQANA